MSDHVMCILCLRPLPKRRWWDKLTDWYIPPPPACRGKEVIECHRLFSVRLGIDKGG